MTHDVQEMNVFALSLKMIQLSCAQASQKSPTESINDTRSAKGWVAA